MLPGPFRTTTLELLRPFRERPASQGPTRQTRKLCQTDSVSDPSPAVTVAAAGRRAAPAAIMTQTKP